MPALRAHLRQQPASLARIVATAALIYVLAIQGVFGAFASARGPDALNGFDHGVICATADGASTSDGAPQQAPAGDAGHCLLCPVACHLASAGLVVSLVAFTLATYFEPARAPRVAFIDAPSNFPPGWTGSRSSRAPPSFA